MEFEGITLDTRDPSFLRSVFGDYTQRGLQSYYDACSQRTASPGPPFVMLVDASAARVPTAQERQISVAFWENAGAHLRGRLLGVAYVIRNPMLRAALKVHSWFRGPPAETRIFESVFEAEHWLRELQTKHR